MPIIVLLTLLCLSSSVAPLTGPPASEFDFKAGCRGGLHRQPNGPFAVLVYCEDALGTHVAVIHASPLGAPARGTWSLRDRYWSEELWAAGLTALRWAPDGRWVFVSTYSTYGSGATFRLDLHRRTAVQLLPPKPVTMSAPGPGYELADLPRK